MQRQYFEISRVRNVTWFQKESSLAGKQEKKQRKMKNMHNGEKGEVHLILFKGRYYIVTSH